MDDSTSRWGWVWAVLAVVAGVGLLMTLEILEEPDMTLGEILFELVEPTLIVMTAAGVVYLLGRVRRQHQEQMTLMRDLEVARAEGAQWRTDMRELLKGLSAAIDAQFDRWGLTPAEREVALLLLTIVLDDVLAPTIGGANHLDDKAAVQAPGAEAE